MGYTVNNKSRINEFPISGQRQHLNINGRTLEKCYSHGRKTLEPTLQPGAEIRLLTALHISSCYQPRTRPGSLPQPMITAFVWSFKTLAITNIPLPATHHQHSQGGWRHGLGETMSICAPKYDKTDLSTKKIMNAKRNEGQ